MTIHPEVEAIYKKIYGFGDAVGADRAFLEAISEHIQILERIIDRDHGNNKTKR